VDCPQHSLGLVEGAERMLESSVVGSTKDYVRSAQLPNPIEALELSGVHHIDLWAMQHNGP
jgi:hypothetical protein